jgi:hypothetical protein
MSLGATLTYTTVIPTKDRACRARAAVEGMLAQTRRPQRIVVVDASEPPLTLGDDLREAVRDAGVELMVVYAPPSTAAQRNRGVERAKTPLVLLLDDDVTLQADYVEVLLERWQRDGLHAFGAIVGAPEYIPPQGWLARTLRRVFMLHYQAPGGEATSFRRSRKLRLVARPSHEVTVPACGAGYGLFRTDLLRRHPFDERFAGYAPGEDLDMSSRLAADAPILQMPSVRYLHEWDPRERMSPMRWHQRGRRETYFRLCHLDGSGMSKAAFAVSLLAEAGIAASDSVRERDRRHLVGFVRGVLQTMRERD